MAMFFLIDVLNRISQECDDRPNAEQQEWIKTGLRELILLVAGSAGLIVDGKIVKDDTRQELGGLPTGQDEDQNGCIRCYCRVLRYLVQQHPLAMAAMEAHLPWLRNAEETLQAFYQSDAAFLSDIGAAHSI
jgi:hypothetical protein